MSNYADLIERLQRRAAAARSELVATAIGDAIHFEQSADAISRLERERAELREALQVADAAIAEMFRYFDGGEMRGSYDGKPERNQLRKAGYLTRQTLSRTQEQTA